MGTLRGMEVMQMWIHDFFFGKTYDLKGFGVNFPIYPGDTQFFSDSGVSINYDRYGTAYIRMDVAISIVGNRIKSMLKDTAELKNILDEENKKVEIVRQENIRLEKEKDSISTELTSLKKIVSEYSICITKMRTDFQSAYKTGMDTINLSVQNVQKTAQEKEAKLKSIDAEKIVSNAVEELKKRIDKSMESAKPRIEAEIQERIDEMIAESKTKMPKLPEIKVEEKVTF